jgi:hypothetical protein
MAIGRVPVDKEDLAAVVDLEAVSTIRRRERQTHFPKASFETRLGVHAPVVRSGQSRPDQRRYQTVWCTDGLKAEAVPPLIPRIVEFLVVDWSTEGSKRSVDKTPNLPPLETRALRDGGGEAAEQIIALKPRMKGEQLAIALLDVSDEVVKI